MREQAKGVPLIDRYVYLRRIEDHSLSYDTFEYEGLSDYVANEYTWGLVLRFLSDTVGLNADATLTLLSAFVVFTSAALVSRYCSFPWLFLLCNPLFVNLAFSQIRIAFALSVATWLVISQARSPWIVVPTIVFATTIHTGFALVAVMYFLAYVSGAKCFVSRPKVQMALVVAAGLLGALLMGPLRAGILDTLEDRRADVQYATSLPILYLVWLLLLVTFVFSWQTVRATTAGRFSSILVTLALLGTVLNGYPDRFLATSLPFTVVAMHSLRAPYRSLMVLAYLTYTVILWVYWF